MFGESPFGEDPFGEEPSDNSGAIAAPTPGDAVDLLLLGLVRAFLLVLLPWSL
jgi:hypothetical protein